MSELAEATLQDAKECPKPVKHDIESILALNNWAKARNVTANYAEDYLLHRYNHPELQVTTAYFALIMLAYHLYTVGFR